MATRVKPRVPFCWWCGHKLRGWFHREVEIDGHMRILHTTCVEKALTEDDVPW